MHKHYYRSFSNCDNKIIDNDINFEHVLNLDKHLENDFNDMIIKPENSIKYSFFIDEIKNLLTQSPRRTGCDLTERYYNTKILHYMRQCSIYKKMHKSEEKPEKELLMERTATIVAQYIQLEKDVLKNKYGRKIILYIIYHSVARRLGLRCNLIRLPERFICLYWKPDYATNSLEKVRCFTICSKKFPDCLVNQMSLYRTLYSEESFPYNIGAAWMWLEIGKLFAYSTNRYNKPFGINWREYDRRFMISRKLMLSFKNTEQLNTRPENVKYSVAMIVTHSDEPTCAGVIIGWHH